MNIILNFKGYFLKFGLFSIVVLCYLACQARPASSPKSAEDQGAGHHETEKTVIHFPSRQEMLSKLGKDTYDVLIIGGGATGAGALLDAASRGLKVAMIERQDFSSGTSSRSTKLVHGGVRYLENAVKKLDLEQYQLVRDALRERRLFLENAPHLTNPIAILTPVYSWFDAVYYWIGLKMYDLVASGGSLAPSEFVSKEDTVARFPMLKKDGLKGSVLYYDGQFNDARMNISLILSAIREGADAVNYVSASSLIKSENKVSGVMATDHLTGKSFAINAKIVINATGPFADSVRKMDDNTAAPIMVPSQGSHLLLSKDFSTPNTGLIIPKTKDGRVLFLLPWLGKTIVGTTDLAQAVTDLPKASNDEVEYMLEQLKGYLDVSLKREDILATWSGLRPLAKPPARSGDTASISRDHLIEISKSHLITIVGGKWTTYRKMGEEVIDTAVAVGELSPKNESRTEHLKLIGARFFKESLAKELESFEHLPPDIADHLATSYGDRVDELLHIDNKSRRARIIEAYPFIEAEVIYAIRYEYAITPTDIVARRLRLAFLDHKSAILALPKIGALMANELKWSQAKLMAEIQKGYEFLATMITPSK